MIRIAPEVGAVCTNGPWKTREMVLTGEKISLFWSALQQHGTLFSDLTRGNIHNFVTALMDGSTMWLEIWKGDEEIVGLAWIDGLYEVVDATVHCVYLDRKPAEKDAITKATIAWVFDSYPLHRLTAPTPVIYHATIRMLERIGFKKEGRKRQAVLIGGKWVDMLIFGITREEVEKKCRVS